MNAAGEVQLLNRQVLEYFGKTTEELKNWPPAMPSIRMTFLGDRRVEALGRNRTAV